MQSTEGQQRFRGIYYLSLLGTRKQ